MANFIETYNEKELSELEKEIDSIFREATKETQAKADAYFERIEKLTKTKLQDLADGKITQVEYDSWLRGTIFQKDRFNAFISEYQAMINQYDSNALDMVSTKTPNVFANNANYVAYHLETGQKTDFNFQLWDKTTVDRLMKEDVTLLPPRKLSIPKNNAWNMKAVQRQLTQAILQGDSIPTYAKRLQTVTDMNKTNAVRNARTSMTTAQNAGRQARMEEAEEMGLIIKKVWVATLDGRTRDDHRKLDGATVGISDSFEVEGAKIDYPGDIKAPPSELWNCRCTVIEKYEGITGAAEQRKLDTMKTDEYKAWKGAVEKGEVYEVPKTPTLSQTAKEVVDGAKQRNIEFNQVNALTNKLSTDEIIDRLAGGDMTKGSCASLGLCYVGNKNGLNALDFRGGESQDYFSIKTNTQKLLNLKGVRGFTEKFDNELSGTRGLISSLEKNKEFYLSTGKHAAIIRNTEKGLEYLELQSKVENGWFLVSDTRYKNVTGLLTNRFGCRKTVDKDKYTKFVYQKPVTVIEVDSLNNNTDFQEILGYINTVETEQMKGATGGIK